MSGPHEWSKRDTLYVVLFNYVLPGIVAVFAAACWVWILVWG